MFLIHVFLQPYPTSVIITKANVTASLKTTQRFHYHHCCIFSVSMFPTSIKLAWSQSTPSLSQPLFPSPFPLSLSIPAQIWPLASPPPLIFCMRSVVYFDFCRMPWPQSPAYPFTAEHFQPTMPPANVRIYTHKASPTWLQTQELNKDDANAHVKVDGAASTLPEWLSNSTTTP